MKICQHEYDPLENVYRCKECGSIVCAPAIRECPHVRLSMSLPTEYQLGSNVYYLTCPHRGIAFATISGRVAGHGCGSSVVEVYQCNRFNEPVLKAGKPPCEDTMSEKVPGWKGRTCRECEVPKAAEQVPGRWVTRQQLTADANRLAGMLPPNLAGVIGIPRSGLMVALHLATQLDVDCWEVPFDGRYELRKVATGYRRMGAATRNGPYVLVDDSINRGTAMQGALQAIKKSHLQDKEIVTACVYRNPRSRFVPNISVVTLPMPHLFEWHFFGSTLVQRAGFDIDGVLYDDKQRRPLWLPRPHRVPLIASGRFERHRQQNETWLREHGVTYDRLVLWEGAEDDPKRETGEHKGKAYRDSKAVWFLESSPEQCRVIRDVSHKTVICPVTGELFVP